MAKRNEQNPVVVTETNGSPIDSKELSTLLDDTRVLVRKADIESTLKGAAEIQNSVDAIKKLSLSYNGHLSRLIDETTEAFAYAKGSDGSLQADATNRVVDAIQQVSGMLEAMDGDIRALKGIRIGLKRCIMDVELETD